MYIVTTQRFILLRKYILQILHSLTMFELLCRRRSKYMHEQVQSRLHSGNACRHSVQKHSSCRLLP